MNLRQLLECLPKAVASGDLDIIIKQVTSDSRLVQKGALYVAVKGIENDGHRFIDNAIANGAVAVLSEVAQPADFDQAVTWIHCANNRKNLGLVSSQFYGQPSAQLANVGVTGTNGKTTTCYLIQHIMKQAWLRAGLIGTVEVDDGLERADASHTTPNAEVLHGLFGTMLENGCRGVAMEVSSHGIEQERLAGVQFKAAVFTNLSQDHLDYHGNMEEYFKVKQSFINDVATTRGSYAVVNTDDFYGAKIAKELPEGAKLISFGMNAHCDFKVSNLKEQVKGTEFQLDNRGKSYLVRVPLIGRFNVYNCLGAIAATVAAGIKLRDAVQALAELPQVPGRLELVSSTGGVNVFVDYAHTPDALDKVCSSLKELDPRKLLTVFGCGGDRDAGKRPLMAEAVSQYSDMCFITSDNPRSEDPEAILKEIEPGMKHKVYRSIVDRAEAIRTAIDVASAGDIVLIAGKGHETYQEFADGKVDFDDRRVAKLAMHQKREARQRENEERAREAMLRQKQRDERQPREEREFDPNYKSEHEKPQKYGERRVGGAKDFKRPFNPKRNPGEQSSNE
ncbi:UDP-N-acetylmuramoyl-L-alanyl-D-glutamate--2,6-diaminopimelate ligase [Rubritalea marina]|uniref:UDP-N-acetylmuramoyl-L-alanyl-D-glutamate--2, 6-diaminopimelate ligase n=1 Tax=Rubritalea marina TaxID=361055 RepID=UPI0003AA472C|nr:UDP-N-acetylmuramoyl-L-alanyl-D-glutamate--2,6-diaminopimelate ligase [Rubritalea marina]